MALTHGVYTGFMVNAAKKTVYTPWVNAMSAAFIRIEWSKKISNLSEVWILKNKKKKKKKKNSWRRDSNPRPSYSEASSFTTALLRHMLTQAETKHK